MSSSEECDIDFSEDDCIFHSLTDIICEEMPQGGRILRLFSSHNYLAIYCTGKMKGSSEKQNLHTILKTIPADEKDPSFIYLYGMKAKRYAAVNVNTGVFHAVSSKSNASIFKEDYARSMEDTTIFTENYLTYEYYTSCRQKTGWYISLRSNGKIRKGPHTTKEFVSKLTDEKRRKRQEEIAFLPDNVTDSLVESANTIECEECGQY